MAYKRILEVREARLNRHQYSPYRYETENRLSCSSFRPERNYAKFASVRLTQLEIMAMNMTKWLYADASGSYTVFRGNTLSPSTVNFILLDVLNVIGRMIEWGLRPGPAPKVKLLPSNNERQRFLAPIELERLLDVLEILSCRVYRIALIFMHTGMRVGEVLRYVRSRCRL